MTAQQPARPRRRGLTLLELTIVLAIGAIAALLVLPQWTRGNDAPPPAEVMVAQLFDEARRQAVRARQVVTVRVAGDAARVTIDTAGPQGSGRWREVALSRDVQRVLEPADQRATLVARPTGAMVGDAVTLRTATGVVRVPADPWAAEVHRAP
jgi:prepilin-type N-terminal cleavage/methylation domain-containing protein